jgi:hypothetical protein
LEQAALQMTDSDVEPWQTDLLILPQRWLKQRMYENGGISPLAKDLLLELHRTGWEQSRNLRNHNVEQAQIAHLLGGDAKFSYLARTIQHLIAVQRGDMPGFIPFSNALEAGPFRTVQELLWDKQLDATPGLKGRFPVILQPCHMGPSDGAAVTNFAYYSLTFPSLVGPTCDYAPKILTDLADKLQMISTNKAGHLGEDSWRILQSKNLTKATALHDDFADQFQVAQKKWNLDSTRFFAPVRQGFLARFVRLSNSQASKAKICERGTAA